MSISIIIPTKNAEDHIRDLLDKVINQTIVANEIIIIDTASSDQTIEICRQFKQIKVIQIGQNEFNHGGTRNIAAKESNGEFIVFLTQDALPKDEHFIENLVKPFHIPKVAAVYGRQVARDDATPTEKFTRDFNYPANDIIKSKADIERLGIKAFFFTNVCSAFRRTDFNSVSGFPNNIILNEDMIIASKLILNRRLIAYASKAAVIHSHNYSLRQQFARYFDIGVSLNENNYILKYANVQSEGKKFTKEVFIFLFKNKKYLWMIVFFVESVFKFTGYKLGLHYKLLPLKGVRLLSMHKFYWDKVNENLLLHNKDM